MGDSLEEKFWLGIKKDFPVLQRKINGHRIVYLDSAATSQKPIQVIDAISHFYKTYNANVGRSIHTLAEEATEKFEEAREKVARFISAPSSKEIIFTRNATEAINLVAYSFGQTLKAGDEIISTVMEHHSNIVPWQFLKARGVVLKFADIDENGEIDYEKFRKLLSKKTKLVCLTQVSNVLGTANPVDQICKLAHEVGALVLVDGAQSAPHMPVDVKKLGCDFFAFSGHKMLGPTGIGILWARAEILEKLSPFLGGGDMIREVKLEETTYNELPWKFEAGTPNIEGAIALGAAIDYLEKIGMQKIREHEYELTKYAMEKLSAIKGIIIYGPKDCAGRGGVVSFNLKGAHPHDVAQILDSEGIAIRSGHACCQPLMKRLGIAAVCRASFYIYNSKDDVDALVEGLQKVKKVLRI